MAVGRKTTRAAAADLFELGPPIAERMKFEAAPAPWVVSHYVFTRGSEAAWEAINRGLGEPGGAFYWIGGKPGAGKTHFLNYMMALESRAGLFGAGSGRHATVALELAGRAADARALERMMLDQMAHKVSQDARTVSLWRQMQGESALRTILDQARRLGIGTVAVLLDLGSASAAELAPYLDLLVRLAATTKPLKLVIVAAGRDAYPGRLEAAAFDVAPRDDDEAALAGMGRARRVKEEAAALLDAFYARFGTGRFSAQGIFPFDASCLETLWALSGRPAAVAPIASLVREILDAVAADHLFQAPLFPGELLKYPAGQKRMAARLGERGRLALQAGERAAAALQAPAQARGKAAVELLALDYLAGRAAASTAEIERRLPPSLRQQVVQALAPGRRLGETLAALASLSGGVIRLRGAMASFEPQALDTPELAAFNAALPVTGRLVAGLSPAEGAADLRNKLKRLGEALSEHVEAAHRTLRALSLGADEMGQSLADDSRRLLENFLRIVEGGTAAVLELGAEPQRLAEAEHLAEAYLRLRRVADRLPRLKAMLEYLAGTGLGAARAASGSDDGRLASLDLECELLASALRGAVFSAAGPPLDALEERFSQFRAAYVTAYQRAHARWRLDNERLAARLGELQLRHRALERLDSIEALGPPAAASLNPRVERSGQHPVQCRLDGPLPLDIAPRCPECGLRLGTEVPAGEVEDLFAEVERRLSDKLALLSQDVIGRLVRQHDRHARLEGFLKIAQAAQTEALARVLDDDLTAYLAKLLSEPRQT